MNRRRWSEVREDFERVVFRDGVRDVAQRMNAHPVTVYRLLNGATQRPSGAVQAAAERVVADATPGVGRTVADGDRNQRT